MDHWKAGIGTFLMLCFALPIAQSNPLQSRRSFEIADYYRTVFPSSLDISLDGKLVVFAVRKYDLEAGESWSQLWIMAPDGSGLRQITSANHNDTSPAFSPNGKQIVFVSDREGSKSQLFVVPVTGDEPKRLTWFSMELAAPQWSPDGRWIAVSSQVYPECGIDDGCNRKMAERLGEKKLQAHMADGLLYRHWDSWRDGTYTHVLLVDAKSGKIVKDMTPGSWDSPTFSLAADRGFDFSPDSSELCYVSNHGPDPASSTNADLWIVPVEGTIEENTAKNITAANHGWDGSPLYSPDGLFIGFRSQETPGYESALFRLARYDRRTGSTKYLTEASNFDNWVDELAWSADSKSIIFQGEYQARNPIYRLTLETGQIRPILTDGSIDSWSLIPGSEDLIYARRKISEPPEIFRVGLDSGKSQPLTHLNNSLISEVDFREPEEMWVKGAGDYKVHVFVIKPHGFNPALKYPAILNVHGGPQSQWMDAYRGDWQVYTGKGYVVAFANPTGSTGYGQEFTSAISKDWGGRVFQDLMLVTDAVEKLPYVDKERMGSMGWSYGGYMMMWFEGNTDRFKASSAMMGVYDLTAFFGATEELWFPEWDLGGSPWDSGLYKKWSPSEYVKNFKTPCLVITGERDFRIPYTQSLEFFTALQKMGVPSRLIVYKNAGHWPDWYEMAFYYNAHLDWFHRWLGGEPAPYDMQKFLRNEVFNK
jgi:dipeptidyl aminopeptidase/acylaminoacyl peptidase